MRHIPVTPVGRKEKGSRSGADGHVIHTWFDGATWYTQGLGGTITGPLSATVYNGGYYVVGSNGGKVYQRWYGTSWSNWAQIYTGDGPVVGVFGTQYHVVSRAGDGHLAHAWYNGSVWSSESLGGVLASTPARLSTMEDLRRRQQSRHHLPEVVHRPVERLVEHHGRRGTDQHHLCQWRRVSMAA